MSDDAATLERLLLFAGEALSELDQHLQPQMLRQQLAQLGIGLPLQLLNDPGIDGTAADAAAIAQGIKPALDPLRAAIEEGGEADTAAIISAGVGVAAAIASTLLSLRTLADQLQTSLATLPDAATRDRLIALSKDFPRKLMERFVLDQLDERVEGCAALLAILGLADDRIEWGKHGDPTLPTFQLRRLHMDRLGKILNHPTDFLRETFGWGDTDFDALPWLQSVAHWREVRREPALFLTDRSNPPVDPPALTLGFITLATANETSPPGLAATWQTSVDFDIDEEFDLGETLWSAFFSSKSRFEAGLRMVLTPDGHLSGTGIGAPSLSARAGLRLRRPDNEPISIFGMASGTRLEARSVEVAAGFEKLGSSPFIELKQDGLHLVLDVSGGDGFLQHLTGGSRGKTDITTGAIWSPATGLKFTGSASFEVAIPAHARLGPATLETVYLIGSFAEDAISLEVSAGLRGQLGPFTAVVDRIGVTFNATFPDGGGNLGPVQLEPAFKPPSGLGLSIDGGGFSGGGFLRRDPANGEYGGALELSFQDVIDVKAFGVLNTKLPDGSEGFSLAVVISAEFAPIQLSFGFTLLGVGGLLGVNRTALYDQLRLGLRDGSMNSILFPVNLVANAPRIINDLKRMFPPQPGRFLIGPMAKLGWGTPSIITLDIGLILEIPRPGFAILGILRMALPAKEAAILDLQVNFLGVVDFERKELSFDASLFDSRLLAFTLTGDMALRIYWGDNANFLMTVGGFHPDYVPPPLDLPALNRLAISMWAGNPRLTAEAYFAVTSNTVQFGAKVELYYGVKVFNVYGFISLDALIQFEPFYLIAKVAGQVAVRSGGSTLFAIRLEMTLEGPSPWHAHGTGSFEIGFIFTVTISAGFDVTFGEKRNTSLPPVELRSLIEDALKSDGAWRVLASGRPHVSIRDLTTSPELVVSPLGSLAVAQKAAPLNLALARVGARRIDGANRFSIVDVSFGGSSEPPSMAPAFEQFAAAQYLDLSDAERLSRRSFEPLEAGVEIASGLAPRADAQTRVDVAYEVIYVRKPRRPGLLFKLRDTLLDALLAGSAAAQSKVAKGKTAPTGVGTPKVTVPAEQFVIAGVSDLNPVGSAFSSQTAAYAALQDAVANDPSLTGKLQVVSAFEAAA